MYLNLFGADAVAPQKAAISQVGGIAAGQLAKTVRLAIGGNGFQQFGAVIGLIAGGRLAHAGQHTQGEAHFQGVGVVRQGGDIDGLQVGVFNCGVELGRVLVFCFQAVRDGAAHRFCAHFDMRPGFAGLAIGPVAGKKQRVGRVQLAFKGEDGGVFQFAHAVTPTVSCSVCRVAW